MQVVRHNGSDVKVPWELSRLQFLPVLAKAHLLTGDQRYRDAAKSLFSDWTARNPLGTGVNWTLAMESALRGMSLCFMLSLLQPLKPEEEKWGAEVTRSIWQHLLYTLTHIEFSHLVRSNHYLSNIVGIHCMATFLDGPGMKRCRRKYGRLVQQEILDQVYPDGGNFEASFGYHILVMQLFTSTWLLMKVDGSTPEPAFTARLKAMYRYAAALADADGSLPHVGDCDDGRVELFASDMRQMIELPRERRNSLLVPGCLGLGDALFQIGCDGDPSDAAWYGLRPQTATHDRAPGIVFPQSGVAVGRAGNAEVLFCAIPNGIKGTGSHTHNDKLSVLARLGGTEFLCDSGTLWYTRNSIARNQFRSTAAHNTIVIDGLDQNHILHEPKFLFVIGDEAAVSPIQFSESGNEICLASTHFGYSRIGVTHQRTVRLSPDRLAIEDSLLGEGNHFVEIFWHLPAPYRVENTLQSSGFEIAGPSPIRFSFESTLLLELSHQPAQISRTYGGALQEATRLRITGSGSCPVKIVTSIAW